MSGSKQRLSGGALNAALANELGKLVADFTGRTAEAHTLFRALTGPQSVTTVVAVDGMAGVGKSTLAVDTASVSGCFLVVASVSGVDASSV